MNSKGASKTNWHLFVSISCTILSRLLGFIRSIVETSLLGLSMVTDCYQGAFRLTNFFREVFAEGALGGVYTPLHTRAAAEHGEEEANQFFWVTVFGVFLLSILLVSLLYIFLEPILHFWLLDFSREKLSLTNQFSRIMLPFLVFISTGSMFMVGHYLKGRFVYSTIHPILFSLAVICFGLLNPCNDLGQSLSYGVLVGGACQFFLLAVTLRPGMPSWKGMKKQVPRLRQMLIMLLPVFTALAIHRINRLIDLQFASGLITGTLSALAYAMVILNVPMGLVSIASSNVFYPIIARLKSENKEKEYHQQVSRALSFLLYLAIPLSCFFTLFAQDLVEFLFLKLPTWFQVKTEMEKSSLQLMGESLKFYSLGLAFVIINPLLIKVFHSSLKTKAPALLGSTLVVFNILINMILTPFFAHKGIASATSICAFLHTVFLIRWLWMSETYRFDRKILYISLAYAAVAFGAYTIGGMIPSQFSPLPEFLLGSIIYFLVFIAVQCLRYGSFPWSSS